MISLGTDRSIDDYGGLYKDYWRINVVTPGATTTGESSQHQYGDLRFSGVTGSNVIYEDRMTIRYNGNVGIGTVNPTRKLDVVSTEGGAFNAARFYNSTSDVTGVKTKMEFPVFNGTSGGFLESVGNSVDGYSFEMGAVQSTSVLKFSTGGSERLRIRDSGGITFNGDTAEANALDDYEEGTFSPALNTGTPTYSEQMGSYTKIGNVVFINISLSWTGGPTSGNISIGTLPFTSSATLQLFSPLGQVFNNNLTVSGYDLAGYVGASQTSIQIVNLTSGTNSTNKTYEAAGTIRITGHYFV